MILSPNCCAVKIFEYSSTDVTLLPILGDPGASSWDNALFLGENLLQELKSWDLILNEPVPEVVEFRPADWAEKIFFCPISKNVLSGNSVAFIHEVVFFIDLVHWPVQREEY